MGGLGGYGGLGGLGGGLGSMYGGMGGMGMGMGGMYGRYGGMGMAGMGGEEGGSFFKSIQFMESMSFVINSMCEVVRMLEANTEGIIGLWTSLCNLIKRIKDWFVGVANGTKEKFFSLFYKLLVLVKLEKDLRVEMSEHEKEEAGLTEQEREKLASIRKKKRIYKYLMRSMIFIVFICLYYFYFKGRLITRTIEIPAAAGTVSPGVAIQTEMSGLDSAFNSLK